MNLKKMGKHKHEWENTGKTIQARLGHFEVMRCRKCGEQKKSYYRETVDNYMEDYE